MILVEAAVETLEAALAAERAGAHRLELCANLNEGGTTPGAPFIAEVVARTRLPVFVMIRPRGGDFVYSSGDIDAMSYEVEVAARNGASGIVTGTLTSGGRVALTHMRALTNAAAGMPVTFHRAFDDTEDPRDALEQLIDLGVNRILTSGGAATALEGADAIAALTTQAKGRICIMPGGKVRQHNVRELIRRTGVSEVHARFVDEDEMRNTVGAVQSC